MRFRYHELCENRNKDTGEVYYELKEWHYAFPKQIDIATVIGVNRGVVNYLTKSLEQKEYIHIIEDRKVSSMLDDTGKSIIKNENYKYEVTLLKRYEYMKYLILDQTESYTEIDKRMINEYKKENKNNYYNKMCEDGLMNAVNKYKKLYIENTQMESIKNCFNEYKNKVNKNNKEET
jgi:hypothetical protein